MSKRKNKNKHQLEANQTSGNGPPKGWKNGKYRKAMRFGTDPNGAIYSNERRRMMRHKRERNLKKYNLLLDSAGGKRKPDGSLREEIISPFMKPHDPFTAEGDQTEIARMELLNYLNNERAANGQTSIGRSRPEPDWRSGKLESGPTPRQATHDESHFHTIPKNVAMSNFQEELDRYLPKIQRTVGREKVAFIIGEVAVRAIENLIRRRQGIPSDNCTDKKADTTKPVPPILNPGKPPPYTESEPRNHRAKNKNGQVVDYTRSPNLFKESPCLKKYLQRFLFRADYGIEMWDQDKKMWVDSNSVDALINIRMLIKEEDGYGIKIEDKEMAIKVLKTYGVKKARPLRGLP